MRRGAVGLIVAFGILAAPLTGDAQPPKKTPRIGFLSLGSAADNTESLAAFRERLRELGWVDGRNVAIEARFADRRAERLSDLARELVPFQVDVIVTITTPAALAAKGATTTVPIVMAGSGDPVARGLIASLARPGGNVTGVTNSPGAGFVGKQLQLLKETAPRISRVAALMDPTNPADLAGFRALEAAGRTLGVTLALIEVTSPTQFDPTAVRRAGADALYVSPTAVNWAHHDAIFSLAGTHRLPAIYGERDWIDAGGLMSYWTNWLELRRRAAVYVDKILRGARPADLPVEEPTRYELIINLRTARALGLTIPQSVLVLADELIQ